MGDYLLYILEGNYKTQHLILLDVLAQVPYARDRRGNRFLIVWALIAW